MRRETSCSVSRTIGSFFGSSSLVGRWDCPTVPLLLAAAGPWLAGGVVDCAPPDGTSFGLAIGGDAPPIAEPPGAVCAETMVI